MLQFLKQEANYTYTENGARTHISTLSHCLDLFGTIGALRSAPEEDILRRFSHAHAEDPDIARKTLFFGRDIRGGLGERRVFRTIIRWLADHEPASLAKNIPLIPEYGRFDDLLALMDTPCEEQALRLIRTQLHADLAAPEDKISLLAKWLPSVNTSNPDTVAMAKRIARYLGMTDAQYRKTLAQLRRRIRILENSLRERDYSFDYSQQPSKAMFKYRKAFLRNDGPRYRNFLDQVQQGQATLHTGTLAPYEIIAPCFRGWGANAPLTEAERKSMDVTWNALENFGGDENALVVIDGSGSMYSSTQPMPAMVALSLGIYFAQRNTGAFHNHFITFSENPQMVEIQGRDIAEQVRYCAQFSEVANTNIQKVFELILDTALKHQVPQEELPRKIYIVSDMEFDCCARDASLTNFQYARQLFARHGYQLPDVIFWNVQSCNSQQPVTCNDQGVALVSGCTPRLFQMVAGGIVSPYETMMEIIGSERYAAVVA